MTAAREGAHRGGARVAASNLYFVHGQRIFLGLLALYIQAVIKSHLWNTPAVK